MDKRECVLVMFNSADGFPGMLIKLTNDSLYVFKSVGYNAQLSF